MLDIAYLITSVANPFLLPGELDDASMVSTRANAIYVGDSPNAKIKQFATNVKRYAMSNIDIATYFLKIY